MRVREIHRDGRTALRLRLDVRQFPARQPFGPPGRPALFPVVRAIDVLPREPEAVVPRMVLRFAVGESRAADAPQRAEERFAVLRIEGELPDDVVADAPGERSGIALPVACGCGRQ